MNEEEPTNDVEMDAAGATAAPAEKEKRAYIPGKSPALKKNEELEVDMSAYRTFYSFSTPHAACLSFDALPTTASDEGLSCCFVAGTQADKLRDNKLVVLRVSKLKQKDAGHEDAEDDDDEWSDADSDVSDDDDTDGPNCMRVWRNAALIPHHGGINRVRAARVGTAVVCAVWNDQKKVQVWPLADALRAVETAKKRLSEEGLKDKRPLHTFAGHQCEGFAVDWSSLVTGRLASGDNRGKIHLWSLHEAASWTVEQRPMNGHKSSVEDVQWSPSEEQVLASCSADKSIRLWDVRDPRAAPVCTVSDAHDSDVNVIAWSQLDAHLLLSGGDDSLIRVWDLRCVKEGSAVAQFAHHRSAINSLAWSPTDSTVFAATAEDDQTTLWDLAVEPDAEAMKSGEADPAAANEVPAQLLFIHQGQDEVKEVRWLPQHEGLLATTALDGFNIFRTISV